MVEMSEKEKAEIRKILYPEANTLHARAQTGMHDDTTVGGRFQGNTRPLRPIEDGYPRLPNDNWTQDPVPPEPPLGVEGLECSNFYDGTLSRGHPDLDHMQAQPTATPQSADGEQSPVVADPTVEAAPLSPSGLSPQAHAQLTELMASGLRSSEPQLKRRKLT